MDWKTKLVLPPTYVTLQRLKELRMKEKAGLELKLREEAEAEYKSRLEEEEEEEEQRVKKLKEEEEEEVKRRIDEEKKMKEEEEEIIKTRILLCGEPSRRTRRKNFKKHQEVDDHRQEEVLIVVSEAKQVENLEEGKKKKKKKWGKRKKKKDYEKEEALELEALKPETKSIEEEAIPDTKPKGFIQKDTRQRNFAVEKAVMNQKVEEIEKQFGDLNVNVYKKKKKKMMESKALKQFPQHQMSYIDRCPHSQIKNFSEHGKHIDSVMNPRKASSSSLLWVPKTDEKQN